MPCGSAKDSSHTDKNGESSHCAFQDLDHSILQHSLTLGVNNVKQILMSVQKGTKEVKDILFNECNIIYECKVCANLFRSLANFLYHKRCYCKKHLCEEMLLFDNFEEDAPAVVVQPEPPEENPIPRMVECTVDLVKTDVAKEKSLLAANSSIEGLPEASSTLKEKTGRNKGGRGKEQSEEDGKKTPKSRSESPMISRRTREKNKRVVKTPLPNEPPNKKAAKSAKVVDNAKSLPDTSSKLVKGPVTEPIIQAKEKTPPAIIPPAASDAEDHKQVVTDFKEVVKDSKEMMKDSKEATKDSKALKDSKEVIKDSKTIKDSKEVVKDSKMMKDSKEVIKDSKMMKDSKEMVKDPKDMIKERENKKIANKTLEPLITKACVPSSKEMFIKPLKKIIITKPKSVDLKNGSVFDNIQKNIKANKIGFTKITNAAGKSLQCFPKIIFKTIDGNPHAVFQATDNSKSENISLKNKAEGSVVQTKSDSEKLIIVLKKDSVPPKATALPDTKPVAPPPSEKLSKMAKTQTEFHMTRRKRLLARTDCNVQELKCLTCNACFTSIKTLYFHMLSIHSKKRLYYPCPFCKQLFVQIYGVTRHLISIHNKSKEQINKLRDIIKKKSIWKKVDDASTVPDEDDLKPKPKSVPVKETKPDIKTEDKVHSANVSEGSNLKSVLKLGKNLTLHQCSKCNRVFERKSSQVSHEKFCIMNAIKVETVDLGGIAPISPPPNVSFLSLSPKPANIEPLFHKPIQPHALDFKINARPKRGAEKQMHKDFVNSQTLKWRSANRVDTKAMSAVKKGTLKNLEKKVLNIMNVNNLMCMKCDKTFSSYSNLRRHVAIHVGWTRFKCKYCEYQAYNKSQCWAHIQKAHAVAEEDLEKAVVNLSNSLGKKLPQSPPTCQTTKRLAEVRAKQMPIKTNGLPRMKISKKKSANINLVKPGIVKKYSQTAKKGNFDSKKEEVKKEKGQSTDKKGLLDAKKDKSLTLEKSKNSFEVKREKSQFGEGKKKEKSPILEGKKENLETKREKNQTLENKKEANDAKKEKITESKGDILEIRKERSQSLTSIFKYNVSEFKKEAGNYKSVTTNNPTTIILSKKFPTPTVQSFVAISPESVSSNTSSKSIFPLRSSPRKIESKSPDENSLTRLVTRSGTYTKSGPLPLRSNSVEDLKKSVPQFPEKTYAKKDRLISEWFPKKDLNSNSSRRESAPLIIGLVPASSDGLNVRAKNPAISYERSNC